MAKSKYKKNKQYIITFMNTYTFIATYLHFQQKDNWVFHIDKIIEAPKDGWLFYEKEQVGLPGPLQDFYDIKELTTAYRILYI